MDTAVLTERVRQDEADAALTQRLAEIGLVVTSIQRTALRTVVITRTALGTPMVAVVDRLSNDTDVVFAKLATRVLAPSGGSL